MSLGRRVDDLFVFSALAIGSEALRRSGLGALLSRLCFRVFLSSK